MLLMMAVSSRLAEACNGEFETSWSKTMVGYGGEDTHYALELTYNYGVATYERGEGLQRFVITLNNAATALAQAKALGYAVNDDLVHGPDGYVYEILAATASSERAEPFHSIVLRAADPQALADWYFEFLGLERLTQYEATTRGGDPPSTIVVGFPEQEATGVRFHIESTPSGAPPTITQWEGRNALALPERRLRAINARLVRLAPHLIIHPMRELHEKLGTLFIVILRDPAGYEICLVSSETFDPSVREATNYKGPDWSFRKDALAAITGVKEEL